MATQRSPFAEFLRKAKNSLPVRVLNSAIDDIPRFRFAQNAGQSIQNPVGRFAVQFGAGMAEDLLNTPSDIIQGGLRVGRNNIRELLGTDVRWQDEAADAAQLGGGILNLLTGGVGGSAAKQFGKQSVRHILKQGAKIGTGYGAGYGALEGVETARDLDGLDYAKHVGVNTALGAGTGLVGGTLLSGVGAGVNRYSRLPFQKKLELQRGGMRLDEKPEMGIKSSLDNVVARLREKNTKTDYEAIADSFPDLKLRGKDLERLAKFYRETDTPDKLYSSIYNLVNHKYKGKLGDIRNLEGAIVANASHLQTGQPFKGAKPTPKYERVPHPAETAELPAGLNKPIKEGFDTSIADDFARIEGRINQAEDAFSQKYGNQALDQARIKKVQVGMDDERYIQSLADLSGRETVQVPVSRGGSEVPPPVSPPVRPTRQPNQPPNPDDLIARASNLYESLAPKELVGQDKKAHFKYGVDELRDIYKQIEEGFNQYVSKDDFIKMIEDPDNFPPTPEVERYLDAHRIATEIAHSLTEDPTIGYTENYFPHSAGAKKVIDTLFDDTVINKLNLDEGFFESRTGSLQDYSTQYAEVMGDLAEQTMLRKYGHTQFGSEIEQEIVEHVQKAGSEAMDYVTKLAPKDKERPKILYGSGDITSMIGLGTRTANNIFQKIGKEAPEVYKAFGRLRDGRDLYERRRNEAFDLVEQEDVAGVLNYFADVMELKGARRDKFMERSSQILPEVGLHRYTSKVLSHISYKQPLQNFMDTVAKYDFNAGKTKDFVNSFIDGHLKEQYLEKKLIDTIADNTAKVFSLAQIAGNVKVALVQGTEITRIPAVMGWRPFVAGLRKAFLEKSLLDKKYAFKNAESDFHRRLTGGKGLKNVPKQLSDVLYTPLQIIENWKNRVYAGAAESKGLSDGLSGEELTRFVRNQVFENAHIAHRENTPIFLQNSGIRRLLFQYSQFAVKNMYGKVDAVQERQFAKAFGLLASDLLNLGLIVSFTGIPLKFAYQGLFPAGMGPIANVATDLITTGYDFATAETENAKNKAQDKLGRLAVGNFVPMGSQINKTLGVTGILSRGYEDAPSGQIQYPAPTSPVDIAQGLVFGKSTLDPNKRFYDEFGKRSLDDVQSEEFKALNETDRGLAREYYEGVMGQRGQEDAMEQLKTGTIPADLSQKDIETLQTTGMTIDQLLAKQEAESKKRSDIDKLLTDPSYQGIRDSGRLGEALQSLGYTQQDVEDYKMWKLSNMEVKDRVSYIKGLGGNIDFTKLYKQEVLTSEVAKELERQGIIPDADSLMEKMKMTDVYYQRKALRELDRKTMKALLKNSASTQKQLLNAELSERKKIRSLLAKQPKVKTETVKVSSTLRSLALSGAPTPQKLYRPKPLKLNFKA